MAQNRPSHHRHPTRHAAWGELADLGPGDDFGELGPLLGFPRSATAVASTDVELTAYSVQDFREQVLGDVRGGRDDAVLP